MYYALHVLLCGLVLLLEDSHGAITPWWYGVHSTATDTCYDSSISDYRPCHELGCGFEGLNPCQDLFEGCLFATYEAKDDWFDRIVDNDMPSYRLPPAGENATIITDEPLYHVLLDTPLYNCSVDMGGVAINFCYEVQTPISGTLYRHVECSEADTYDNLRKDIASEWWSEAIDSEGNTFSMADAFNTTAGADGYSRVQMNYLDPDRAVSFYSASMGQAVKLNLTCSHSSSSSSSSAPPNVTSSCVYFETKATNWSPPLLNQTALNVSYRFDAPAAFPIVPQEEAYHYLTNSEAGDVIHNETNIVKRTGEDTASDCWGEYAQYQGEGGEWYHTFPGTDGASYALNHTFYVSQHSLTTSVVQSVYDPTMNDTLWGRNLRLRIKCDTLLDELSFGWVYFATGGLDSFSCDEDVAGIICDFSPTPAPAVVAPTPAPADGVNSSGNGTSVSLEVGLVIAGAVVLFIAAAAFYVLNHRHVGGAKIEPTAPREGLSDETAEQKKRRLSLVGGEAAHPLVAGQGGDSPAAADALHAFDADALHDFDGGGGIMMDDEVEAQAVSGIESIEQGHRDVHGDFKTMQLDGEEHTEWETEHEG